MEGEDGSQFIAHVPVPSQKEVCFILNRVPFKSCKYKIEKNNNFG